MGSHNDRWNHWMSFCGLILSLKDDYQCSGSLEMDFPELCSLLGMKEIPAVTPRPPASVTPTTERGNMGK